MANEWVAVELYGPNNDGNPRRYAVNAATNVSQGQLLDLADDRTVVASTWEGPGSVVASEEHVGGVGVTDISCYTDGLFRTTSSKAILIGDYLTAGGPGSNLVTASSAILTNARTFLTSHGNIQALNAVADATELTVRLKA